MPQKKEIEARKNGIILVNKPSGITSHDVVDIARRKLGCRRIGHAGTLDPLAQGLLIILVGSHTKMFDKFVNFDKKYEGTLKLGKVTSTGDSEGQILAVKDWKGISACQIKNVFETFQGEIEQVPPMVSALRRGGKRLYKLARKGVIIKLKPRKITIYECSPQEIRLPFVDFFVHCSKGTYIRKLSEDIGSKLGCGAHVTKIVRLKIGPFSVEKAVNPGEINESHLQKFTS